MSLHLCSYFSKETNLTKTAFSVGIIDTIVAVLAGFIIFPAAFSVGIQPDAGPSLIFITHCLMYFNKRLAECRYWLISSR